MNPEVVVVLMGSRTIVRGFEIPTSVSGTQTLPCLFVVGTHHSLLTRTVAEMNR